MILLLILDGIGLLSGFLLMTRVPLCVSPQDSSGSSADEPVAIIIPARNEERNLPRLLESIQHHPVLAEVIVVDDSSTDRTPAIAESSNARVVRPGEPPQNVTGKAWACFKGAASTDVPHLLFLDADSFFIRNGLFRVLQSYAASASGTAISVLPFTITKKSYEELSLFFNLLMAFGTGGFGAFQPPRLFGQSLLIQHSLYDEVGGHAVVGNFVLENFHMARQLEATGARSRCFGGKGTLHMRMFPDGLRQLSDGWTKAFADGAQSTDIRVLLVSILWLSALASTTILLWVTPQQQQRLAELLYLLAAIQVYLFAREIGTFRPWTCLLFPLPLVFFFLVFTRSFLRKALGQRTNWRGRNV